MPWVEHHHGSWLVRMWDDHRKVTDSVHHNETEARLRLTQLNNMRVLATARRPGAAPTLAEWATTWLTLRQIDPQTADTYRTQLTTHLLPELGHLHLEQIDQPVIIGLARRLQAMLYAPSVIRTVITLLGTMLRDAIHLGYLAHDPTIGIRIPRPLATPRPVLSAAQVVAVADRMPNDSLRVMVITAAFTGMRPGESAAVQKHNVHDGDTSSLGLPYLTIDPLHGARHEHEGRRWLGKVKTPHSARSIFLPPFLHQMLTDIAPARDGLLFTLIGGQILPRQAFNRHWRRACDGDEQRDWPPIHPGLRFNQLRHNHRAWMDEDTIDEAVQNTRLGHRHKAHQLPLRRLAASQEPLLVALQRRWGKPATLPPCPDLPGAARPPPRKCRTNFVASSVGMC